ncbi:MAG: AbrB/MazE/SpoVT family DNA-binding domain-containing protein [Anaerolineaceae bacterium]
MRAKLIKIGNSRGLRIPRAVLEQTGLTDEVEMNVEGRRLVIHSAHQPRQDWEERFSAMHQAGDDRMIIPITDTTWDDEEWNW